jgi:hypothetical protein
MNSKRYKNIRATVLLFAAAVMLFTAPTAFSQGTTGSLRGQILDPSGAAVSGASVTVTNQNTGVSLTIQTTSAGTYAVPKLLRKSTITMTRRRSKICRIPRVY